VELRTYPHGRERLPAEPTWLAVEDLLERLAGTRASFRTATSAASWISSYERGHRIRLETDSGSRWIGVESIRACWETFERLGRIDRQDVLDPGRSSAFMMALFQQLAGVDWEDGEETHLVLLRPAGAGVAAPPLHSPLN
jgi:hypothetical protein